MTDKSPVDRRRFWLILSTVVTLLSSVPFFLALIGTPNGGLYLGSTLSTDDHMVYAAWMRQAKDGHFLFDNRFTTDAQPALTVHVYFLLLGLIAKLTGIPMASTIGRLVFTFLFVLGLGRLIDRLQWCDKRTFFAALLAIFGGGFGFLVWHNFKGDITLPVPDLLKDFLLGRLPMDVKQPEAFVFPSMLNNGLFMVSMWLILVIFEAVIDAKKSSLNVWKGALAMAVLMNIHSYDVLLVALVLLAFLASQWREISKEWVTRGTLIAAGAIIPALWFIHVLKSDPVFQARAATETFSLNFRSVIFGLLPLVGLALFGLWPKEDSKRLAWGALVVGLVVLTIAAASNGQGYFMGPAPWLLVFAIGVAVVVTLAEPGQDTRNLMVAWAVIGLVAVYFPQLFQRKLGEAIVIPWAILATDGLFRMFMGQSSNVRKLAIGACGIVCGASSMRWFTQDLTLFRANVSTTTVHPAYLSEDETRLVSTLDAVSGRKVVAAMPGVPNAVQGEPVDGKPSVVPDQFNTPLVSDFNTVASGLTGAYSICGHWSETPKYLDRRRTVQSLFTSRMPLGELKSQLHELGITHVVVPMTILSSLNPEIVNVGKALYDGKTIRLIAVE